MSDSTKKLIAWFNFGMVINGPEFQKNFEDSLEALDPETSKEFQEMKEVINKIGNENE